MFYEIDSLRIVRQANQPIIHGNYLLYSAVVTVTYKSENT